MSVSHLLVISITAIGAASYTAFTWWTVRRLWQPASTPYRRIVYKLGVRAGGISFWIVMSVASALNAHTAKVPAWGDALIALWAGFPISLWGGYFFGRFMALVSGVSESP